MWWMGRMRGSEKETAEEGAEVETSSGAEATAKGKEQMTFASSSDKERTEEESTDDVTEDKGAGGAGQAKKKSKRREKKERRRAKLFRASTAELVAVRTLEMAMEFKPMPNQEVVLQVPEDVDVQEFVTIARYAEHVGYKIQNEREMMLLMLRKFENMVVTQVEDEAGPLRPQSGAEGTTSDDGGGQRSSESTSYSSTHATAGSRGRAAARTRRRPPSF